MGNKRFIIIVSLLLILGPIYSQDKKNALTLYRQGKYNESVTVCLEELNTLPTSKFIERMDSYTVLLWSLIAIKNYDDVIKYGMEAYNRTNRDWRILASLGEAHYHLGNNKESLFFLERYIEIQPSGNRADYMYYLMGHLFIRMEEYKRADIALSMAVFLKPLDAKWWTRLGYAREQAKDFNRAKDAYNKALYINPNLSEAERGKERVHKSLGI